MVTLFELCPVELYIVVSDMSSYFIKIIIMDAISQDILLSRQQYFSLNTKENYMQERGKPIEALNLWA
jgi:hypothetical protein